MLDEVKGLGSVMGGVEDAYDPKCIFSLRCMNGTHKGTRAFFAHELSAAIAFSKRKLSNAMHVKHDFTSNDAFSCPKG